MDEKKQIFECDPSSDSGFVSGQNVEQSDASAVFSVGSDASAQSSEFEQNLSHSIANLKLDDPKKTGKRILEVLYGHNCRYNGNTFLHLAVLKGSLEHVLAIIKLTVHPCLLNLENDKYMTALHIAVLCHRVDIVRHLVLAGADVNLHAKDGNTALHMACVQNDLECLRALTAPILDEERTKFPTVDKINFDVNAVNFDGETCVHISTYNNNPEMLKYLVQIGANINAQEYLRGLTPLHITIKQNNYKLFHFILNEFQDSLYPDIRNYSLKTPFQFAKKECWRNQNLYLNDLVGFGIEVDSESASDDGADDDIFDNDDDNDFNDIFMSESREMVA